MGRLESAHLLQRMDQDNLDEEDEDDTNSAWLSSCWIVGGRHSTELLDLNYIRLN